MALSRCVLIDAPTWRKPGGRKRYSHVWCADRAYLRAFCWQAAALGRHYEHVRPFPHYDAAEEHFEALVAAGARVVRPRRLVAAARAAQRAT